MSTPTYQVLQGGDGSELLDVVVAEEEDGEGEVRVEGGYVGQFVEGHVEVGQLAQRLQTEAV